MSTEKLKVGFVFDDSLDSSDGVAQYVKTIGSWLAGQGHQVRYLVGETKATAWADGKIYSLAKNYRVKFNGNWLSIPGPASRRSIRQVLETEKFDVLHVQVPYSPLLAARVIKLAPKTTAVVGTFHIYPAGFLSRAGSRLLWLALMPSLRRFSQIVSVSAVAGEFAKEAYGINAQVVPNAVNIDKFKPTKQPKQSGVVFLGRLVERKGCHQLLQAFEILHQDLPQAHLIIAGDGPQRSRLEAYVQKHGLSNAVTFEGFVSDERRAELLASAAIACFPSLYGEAFGIVLIEAMAAGAGVVLGGDNPGYKSVLNFCPQALFDPTNKPELADLLKVFLSDPLKAQQVHKAQQERIDQYDVSVVGAKLVKLYTEAIAKQRAFRA